MSPQGMNVEVKGAAELAAQLGALPGELDKQRKSALGTAGQMMVGHWKLRLSGPRSKRRLGIISGNLRNSIRAGRIERGRVRVGTHLPYAAVHEYGFRGTVVVRAHQRKSRLGNVHTVDTHLRDMDMPERPHLRPAIKSARRPIVMLFQGKVEEAIRLSKKRGAAIRSAQLNLAGGG